MNIHFLSPVISLCVVATLPSFSCRASVPDYRIPFSICRVLFFTNLNNLAVYTTIISVFLFFTAIEISIKRSKYKCTYNWQNANNSKVVAFCNWFFIIFNILGIILFIYFWVHKEEYKTPKKNNLLKELEG